MDASTCGAPLSDAAIASATVRAADLLPHPENIGPTVPAGRSGPDAAERRTTLGPPRTERRAGRSAYHPLRVPSRRRAILAATLVAIGLGAGLGAWRGLGGTGQRGQGGDALAGGRDRDGGSAGVPDPDGGAPHGGGGSFPAPPVSGEPWHDGDAPAGGWTGAWEPPLPHGAEGWEEAAETVALELRRLLEGRARGGAYEQARAEAARQDLALFPPDEARLRRLLLSPAVADRVHALAALAVRPDAPDDLVRIALRSARPDDDELLRLLAAELAASLPPEQLARHEEDLLRAFEREPNPLVLAVALPALERLEPERLRALVMGQLAVAAPEMVPILAALARDRLGPEALRSVGVPVAGADP